MRLQECEDFGEGRLLLDGSAEPSFASDIGELWRAG